MGCIKNEDIIGYEIEGRVYCCECFKDEFGDNPEIREDEILTEQNRDDYDGLIFCDIHKKEI